jgi:hypothetical protein
MQESLDSIKNSLSDIYDSAKKIFNFFTGDEADNLGFEILKDILIFIETTIENIATALETISNPFEKIGESFNNLAKSWEEFKGLGGFSKLYDELKKQPGLIQSFSNLFGKVSYVAPKSNAFKQNVTQTNTFNVYGNDPYATATLVSKNMNGLNTRNFQGVIT